MMRWLTLFFALCASACVEGRFSERGEAADTFILDEYANKTPNEVVIEGRTVFIRYEETSCTKLKFTYLQNHYEQKAFPTSIVSPLALGLAATGLIFGLTSQDPGFFWPESVPAITPIGFGTAAVFGVVGFIPIAFGLGKPQYTLLSTSKSDEYDRVETNCSTAKKTKTGDLPWRAWFNDAHVVTGTTGSNGVLDLRKAALTTVLKGEKMTPSKLNDYEEDSVVYLKYEFGGEKHIEELELYEVQIYASNAREECSEACIDAAEARQCRRRESLCNEESGTSPGLCRNMRISCLETESPNKAGYEACFDPCVKKRLTDFINKK